MRWSSTVAVLVDYVPFHGLLLIVWGARAISMIGEQWSALTSRSWTLAILLDFSLFHGRLHIVLGSRRNFHDWWTLECAYGPVINTRCFGRFWPVSWSIAYSFWVLKHFPWLMNPYVHLRDSHKNSQFWSIMAHFMGYCSSFWGAKAISIIDEPWSALTGRS